MTTVRDQVAEEVRALLARRRLSARAAARQLQWTPNYLSRRMTGTAPFDVDDLAALSHLLDVPVTAFFEGVSYRTTTELSLVGDIKPVPTCTLVTFRAAEYVPVASRAA